MVKDPRAPTRPGALLPLNPPLPLKVQEGPEGLPLNILINWEWVPVSEVQDRWRIDDEWWREQPISRVYFQVLLQDGRAITLFRDLLHDGWYQQRHG